MGALSLIVSGILLFLPACGELGTVLPSTGSYRISAFVSKMETAGLDTGGEKNTLDENSIIGKDTVIYPFFVSSVINDPDVQGLEVHVEDKMGKIGVPVRYVLRSFSAEREEGVETVYVGRLDDEFPAFPLPEDLAIGNYTLIFQVLGEKETLYRAEKPFYYVGDIDFRPEDIRVYLPYSSDSRLIPPGASVLLETGAACAEDIDPYIIWHNGRKRLGEGKISEGAGRVLWKAGDQTGFDTIRAEIFPFVPEPELRGYSREISLMISAKAKDGNVFRREEASLAHWYQFSGDLSDAKAPTATGKALVPKTGLAPRWFPAEGIYGLSVGPGDAYFLEDPALSVEAEQAAGRLMIRFRPVAEGTILNTVCALEDSSEAPEMTLFCDRESLHFLVRTSQSSKTLTVPLFRYGGFINAVIDFTVDSKNFTAGLVLETDIFPPETLSLAGTVRETVKLKKSFWLGGPAPGKTEESSAGDRSGELLPAVSAGSGLFPEQGITDKGAIIDEFAVSVIQPVEAPFENLGPF
ncbi:MAG: hypothetical protein LBI86_00430 [Treponema sp.]|jgi:hypothetical protein|nr:hypothetical protein [Treponema sp.]